MHRLQAEKGLSVYPNPFGNHLSIVSELKEIKSIDIYTYDGRLVEQLQVSGYSANINSSLMKSGLYLLQVIFADGSRYASKLVKY
ncbi:MAG: T9SS type A sorting domain-containing protein [Bacteroidales bacterium]|nr:T9SS type A sorting domain-containing protein [Bacteroidales bacterium]